MHSASLPDFHLLTPSGQAVSNSLIYVLHQFMDDFSPLSRLLLQCLPNVDHDAQLFVQMPQCVKGECFTKFSTSILPADFSAPFGLS